MFLCFRDTFSKNGQPTLVPKPDSSAPIGTARRMSRNDITRINRLYKCNETDETDVLSVRLAIQSTAIEGESVILQCSGAGGNQNGVTWRKDGLVLTQGPRITVAEGLLEISPLEQGDEGDYSCTLATEATAETATATLTVYYKCLTLGGLIGIVIACFIVLGALCISIWLLVTQRR
ncbi:vascular endothelial growth factor receptor kdr-like isoform X2 [Clupea harengus]|nr:vascular endothelial growth factor receptor kdr-like isoform X2 [Clupea harengus]